MGVNLDNMEVEDCVYENYFMGVQVRNRLSNLRFWIINVYGPADHAFSTTFIHDLSTACTNPDLPILMGVILT